MLPGVNDFVASARSSLHAADAVICVIGRRPNTITSAKSKAKKDFPLLLLSLFIVSPTLLSFLSSLSISNARRALFVCRVAPPLSFYPSRANRAAAPLRPRPGVHHRAPDMPLAALPPDFSPASAGHVLRRERRVQFRVPLRRDLRLQRRKVIEPSHHPPARAIGAAILPRCPM